MEALSLRPEVRVRTDDENVLLEFAHWTVTLPGSAVFTDEALAKLLAGREISPAALSEQSTRIVSLLDAQGCLLPALPEEMTARDVLKLFQPLRSHLYAEYYRHPEWARIRTGEASRGELEAWMIHNYHVSRSAGVIAARMASYASSANERAFFQQDALEEYWHCDAFYFVRKANVELSPADVKSYVPLAASTGFEEHALRMAEEDPIAHLLIAYFQESSIVFRSDSEAFYDQVEKHYGIPDAFIGWRRHMTLDLDHDHAGELESRFDDQVRITRSQAEKAIRNVHLAQFFLLRALDDIAAHGQFDSGVALRQPLAVVDSNKTAPQMRARKLTRSDGTYLLQAIRDAAFRALAFARDHESIISAGRFAALVQVAAVDTDVEYADRNPWLIASRNFLMERSTDVQLFLGVCSWLADRVMQDCPELAPRFNGMQDHTGRSEPEQLRVELFRLSELLARVALNDQLAILPIARG